MNRIENITVVGAGYMGGGIAQSFARGGYRVTIADVSKSAAEQALTRLVDEAAEYESDGLFEPGSAKLVRENLVAADSIEKAVQGADFIEEAVFEDSEIKRSVLKVISDSAKPDAIIGTNTSTISAAELEVSVINPERFLTVHFSNPAPFIPGVELVSGTKTSSVTITRVKELLKTINREGAEVADSPGMVLNRLQYALLKEAFLTVKDGIASYEDVDTIVRTTFGFRLGIFGPFAIADQAGLDIYVAGYKNIAEAHGERFSAPELLTEAVESGKYGLKNRRGLRHTFNEDDAEAIVSYRNRAYAEMLKLTTQLGPAPFPKHEHKED